MFLLVDVRVPDTLWNLAENCSKSCSDLSKIVIIVVDPCCQLATPCPIQIEEFVVKVWLCLLEISDIEIVHSCSAGYAKVNLSSSAAFCLVDRRCPLEFASVRKPIGDALRASAAWLAQRWDAIQAETAVKPSLPAARKSIVKRKAASLKRSPNTIALSGERLGTQQSK